jgi:uncharacterized membrane protein (DUF2068 family)
MDVAPDVQSFGLRAIAVLKGAKGLGALLGGVGAGFLMHRNIEDLTQQLLARLHLDPAGRYASDLLRVVLQVTPGNLRWAMLAALAYGAVQGVEAVGLWKCQRWAEWLTVMTGLIYVPFEIVAITRSATWVPWLALAMNLGIVLFLGLQLRRASPSTKGWPDACTSA